MFVVVVAADGMKARERNAIGEIARGREREREKKRTRSLLPLEKKSILGKSGDG